MQSIYGYLVDLLYIKAWRFQWGRLSNSSLYTAACSTDTWLDDRSWLFWVIFLRTFKWEQVKIFFLDEYLWVGWSLVKITKLISDDYAVSHSQQKKKKKKRKVGPYDHSILCTLPVLVFSGFCFVEVCCCLVLWFFLAIPMIL